MSPRSWKNLSAPSLSRGIELSLEFAKEKQNFSVDRIADHMGLANKWVIYKWMENGRLPAVLIRPFEAACGIDLVTRYLCHSNHKLLIDIPRGRRVSKTALHELQAQFATAVGLLVQFYEGGQDATKTLGALTALMEDVAWHRANVETHHQPGLDLTGEEA